MSAYYNELDPYAEQWLRNLIAAGQIAPGDVDNRSINDVSANDLKGYTQCHFFAGIGVWSLALRRAGWADDVPVWTGSCPCQPFSAAGQQKGFDDERHLWPVWFNLIQECRPAIVLGEQVASALNWLDLVSTDLEAADYTFGASDLCAAGFGGAHIRQRLYFVAHADNAGSQGRDRVRECADQRAAGQGGVDGGLADPSPEFDDGSRIAGKGRRIEHPNSGAIIRLADTDCSGAECRPGNDEKAPGVSQAERQSIKRPDVSQRGGANNGRYRTGGSDGTSSHQDRPHAPLLGWNPADWLYCRDGKWRPVEPGTFPLADAAPSRVGRLRAYGNGLDAETAFQFISAVMECRP